MSNTGLYAVDEGMSIIWHKIERNAFEYSFHHIHVLRRPMTFSTGQGTKEGDVPICRGNHRQWWQWIVGSHWQAFEEFSLPTLTEMGLQKWRARSTDPQHFMLEQMVKITCACIRRPDVGSLCHNEDGRCLDQVWSLSHGMKMVIFDERYAIGAQDQQCNEYRTVEELNL